MNAKLFLRLSASLLILVLVLSGSCGRAKQKVYRVGILSGWDFFADTALGFKQKMTELGYIEGKNVVYDLQKANNDISAYKPILGKFVNDKVDLIFVFPSEASMDAKAAAFESKIPVVFAVANVEGTGLINSVREPGGNITGVRWPGPDLAIKRFEIMRELAPQVKRMWVAYQKDYPIVKSQLEVLRPAAVSAGVTLIEIPAGDAKELSAELKKRSKEVNSKTDAILMIADPFSVTPDAFVAEAKFAAEHGIPIGGNLMRIGEYESIFGIIPQNVPIGKQAAILADKVLKGTSAGTIPVVSAEGYFQINYKAARKLGLNVSEGLLSRADEIIR